MVNVIVVQKTLSRLKDRDLRHLARENGLDSKASRTQIIQYLLNPRWMGGGLPETDWGALPTPALTEMFKNMSQADISRLQLASPTLFRRLKQEAEISASKGEKAFLKETIASRPKNMIRLAPILEAIADDNARVRAFKNDYGVFVEGLRGFFDFKDFMINATSNSNIRVIQMGGVVGYENFNEVLNHVVAERLLFIDLRDTFEIRETQEYLDAIILFLKNNSTCLVAVTASVQSNIIWTLQPSIANDEDSKEAFCRLIWLPQMSLKPGAFDKLQFGNFSREQKKTIKKNHEIAFKVFDALRRKE